MKVVDMIIKAVEKAVERKGYTNVKFEYDGRYGDLEFTDNVKVYAAGWVDLYIEDIDLARSLPVLAYRYTKGDLDSDDVLKFDIILGE